MHNTPHGPAVTAARGEDKDVFAESSSIDNVNTMFLYGLGGLGIKTAKTHSVLLVDLLKLLLASFIRRSWHCQWLFAPNNNDLDVVYEEDTV